MLLTLLFSLGCVFASDDAVNNNQTVLDTSDGDVLQISNDSVYIENSREITVENWDEIQYYSSLSDDNYVLKLKENTNYYPTDPSDVSYQVIFRNNVTIIGASGAYIGDTSPDAQNITYTAMKVPDSTGVGITLKNVTFKWIGTKYQPDGVFLEMGGNAVNYFQNCYFTNISTNLGHSSILYIKLGDAIVENCTFINCTTDFGCLSVYNPNDDPTGLCTRARMNVSDSYFEGNYARTEPGCINNCGILIVRNSTFYRNSAFWWAGAIHTHGGANTTIYDSDFLDNLAGWNGGALYTYSYLQIYNSRFIGNNCTTNNGGGAIGACKYLHAPYIHIEDSLFENNENLCWGLDELSTSGTGRGGAISLMDEGGLEVYNTTFIKNSASIGTAICAIAGGLTYGSPDVKIIGNRFINHTRVGDVLDVRVATGSVAEISDNYFLNNSIVFSKLKLTADDPDSSGRVTFHIDAALKNPNSYDQGILDKSDYDVYVDGVYRTTVSSRTFTLNLGNGNTANVYVVPCISNSKSNEVLAGKAKTYIYVSQSRGNDNNNGLTRSQPVKTLNKSIELARSTENIIILDGTFKETNIVIDYNLTITAEGNVLVTVTGSGFKITDGDVKFEKLTFKNCKSTNSKDRIIQQTNSGFLVIEDCVFETNNYDYYLIDAAGQLEAENLRFTDNTACLFFTQSTVIKSSVFTGNIANSNGKRDTLFRPKSKTVKFVAENLTFSNNDVMKGCIDVKDGSTTITDCSFINNYISSSSSARSSGVYIESGSCLIESCSFINNTDIGKYPSVIYVSSGSALIRNSIFLNNSYENDNNVIINGGTSGLKGITADNNWWGNTPENLSKPNLKVFPPSNQVPNGKDPAKFWLVLNVTSLSNDIELNREVPVQFMFTQIDNDGNVTAYDANGLPSFDLYLTAVNGTCSNSKLTVKNGVATTYFTLTQMSSASLTGSFNGINVTINFEFKKSTPDMVISTKDILVGDAANITVNVDSGVSGNIVLKVGNITRTETIADSKATFLIAGLPAGNYTVEANYTGNDMYDSTVKTANLTVAKHDSTTSLSVGSIELNNDVVFTITLSDGATGTVDVYVNGIKHTVDVGETYTIPNVSRGDYVVRAVYSGDSYYLASEDEYVFDVGKFIPSLNVNVLDITYGDDTTVDVSLNSDATGNVTVTIDGKTSSSVLKNGNARVIISGIEAGNSKQVYVSYTGDHNYKNASTTKTYNVGKAILNFTVTCNDIRLGDDAVIEIKLPQRSGGTLTITGIRSETKNVPLTGLVTLTYSGLAVGTYTVSVRYDGDNYQTTQKSATFGVSDWNAPQWPNEGYDVQNTEKSPYSSQANGNVVWVTDINGEIIGNMVIDSEGNIYIVTTNGIYSVGGHGEINWNFNSNDAGNNFSGLAIGRDVILSPKSADKLYFINQTTGLQFANNIYQGSSVFAPVIDENANIYITSEYQTSTESYNLVIVPYSIWRTSTKPIEIDIGQSRPLTAPVLVNSNIVAIGTESGLIIVDVSSQSIIASTNVVSVVRPVAGPGNIIYAISSNSKVVAIAADGTKIRETNINGTPGNYLSVGENGEIYSITREGKLYDYSSGEETLIYDFNETISAGLLVGQDGMLYVGSESGVFYAIDNEGNLMWTVNLNQSISGLPVMDSNGVIYVVSGNRIVAINDAPLSDSQLSAEIKNVTYHQDVVVNVDLDSQASGKVSIKIGNYYINESTIANGKVSFTVSDLNAGNYTAEITYNGDNRFDSKTINVKFNVGKIDSPMNVTLSNIDDVLEIKVSNLAGDAGGIVSVTVSDKSNSSNVLNGRADVNISGLVKGTHNVTVTYSGDTNYNSKTVQRQVSIGYIHMSFNAVSSNVNVDEDVEISISGLPSDANGACYVEYNDARYIDYVVNGNAKITIPDLDSGTYDFDVIYFNDTKYSADSKGVHVVVSKITPSFTVSAENINVGDDLVVDVSGLPSDAKGLVIVSIANITENSSVGNGAANIIIPQRLANGTYSVNVSYTGDRKYNAINDIKTVKISKVDADFAVSVKNINVGDDLVVDVLGLSSDATGQINVSIDGISNSSDVENGMASVIIHQRLANGTYYVTISYGGDDKYNPLIRNASVKISKIPPQIVVVGANEINVGDDFVVEVSGIPENTTVKYVDLIGDIVAKELIKNGNSKFTISNLTYGTYSYSIYFEGDDRYNSFKADRVLKVNKIKPTITIESGNINYNETLAVTVNLPEDASGSVTVSVAEESTTVNVNNGVANAELFGLSAGNKTVNVEYSGDAKYESVSDSKEIIINKINPTINIDAANIVVGDDLLVKVILPSDASGEVNVSVGNKFKVGYLQDGKVNVTISDLAFGSQTVNVQYSGDSNYNAASGSMVICVNKRDSILDVRADESIHVGDALNISVYLPNAGGLVSVLVNNEVVDSSYLADGVARLTISNLGAGNHSYTISYEGDERYYNNSTVKEVTVNKFNPTMNVIANSISIGEDLIITVNLPSDATGSVDISINNEVKTVKVNNGIATYNISGLGEGTYPFTVSYPGDNRYNSINQSGSVKVAKSQIEFDASVKDISYGDDAVVNVGGLPGDANGNVTVVLNNGDSYSSKATNGKANVILSGLNAGFYEAVISYSDDKYDAITKSLSFNVVKTDPSLSIESNDIAVGEDLVVKVILPGDAAGEVTISIGGASQIVNVKDGEANVVISGLGSGTQTISVQYSGDNNYNAINTSKVVSVDKWDVDLDVVALESIVVGDVLNISVYLPPDACGVVSVSVNSKIVDSANITSGAAKLTISGLDVGSHSYTISYGGDDKYDGNSTVKEVVVGKINPKMNVTAENVNVGEDLIITVNLPGDATGTVVISINDKTESFSVNNGIVSYNVSDLAKGSYNLTVTYEGDDKYEAPPFSKTIDVGKQNITFAVSVNNISYGEDAIVVVTGLPSDATGNVTVVLDDKRYSSKVNDGKVNVTISGLSADSYDAIIIYSNDEKYMADQKTVSFNVDKIKPSISIEANDITVGEDLVVKVILPSGANGEAIVDVGGVSHVVNVKDGVANAVISGLISGSQTISVQYSGDSNYNSTNSSKVIVVKKLGVVLDVVAFDFIAVGDVLNISVYLQGDACGVVNVSLNNKIVDSANVASGVARLTISNLKEENYTYTISYEGDDKYDGNSTIKDVIVSKINPKLNVVANNITVGEDLIVTVNLPVDATGNVIFVLNNKVQSVKINNGTATYEVSGLGEGEYPFTVSYEGDDKYNPMDCSGSVNVARSPVEFNASVNGISYGEDAVVNVDGLPGDANGNVTVVLNNSATYSSKATNGKANVILSGLNAGFYEAVISYSDDKYYAITKFLSFNVVKKDPSLSIEANDITVGENLVVKVILPGDANGEAIVSVGSESQIVNVKDGVANAVISGLGSGSQTITVQYNGNNNYNPANASKVIFVDKCNLTLSIQANDIEVGSDLVIKVYMDDDATGILTVSVDGKTERAVISEGIANISISGLTEGIKTIEVTYDGDDKFNACNASKSVTVSKINPALSIEADDIDYGEDLIVTVCLPSDATGDVAVSIADKSFTSQLINGTATFTISGLNTDDNIINVNYFGDDKYEGTSQSKSIVISKIDSTISVSADNINVGDSLNVVVELPEDATGIVQINVSGIIRMANVNNGIASVDISGLTAGTHIIYAEYSGDKNYNSSSSSKSVIVSKVNPTILVEADDIKFGEDMIVRINMPKDATGDIVVKVDGKTYRLRPNEGIAILRVSNLNAGSKLVEVNYAGDDKYNNVSASKSAAVNKITPIITVLADDIRYGELLDVNVQLSEKINGTVVISAGNISKTVQLLSGLASAQIAGLTGGSQIVHVRFNGNSNYDVSTASKTIAVGRIAPCINITANDIMHGEKLEIEVSLNDDATGNVAVSVGGVSRTIAVRNGVVSLVVDDLTAGVKNINVRYAGDNNYYSASATKMITVSKIDTPVIIQADDISYGENLVVNVTLDEGVTGNVLVSVGDAYQTEKIVNGIAHVVISGLASGNYTVVVKYGGDTNYNGAENSTSLRVLKVDIPVTDETIQESDDYNSYSIDLPLDATGTFTVSVDGKNYTSKVVNGRATVNIPQLTGGNHNIVVSYSGDKKYSPIVKSSVVNINETPQNTTQDKRKTELTVAAADITVGDSAVVNVEMSVKSAKITLTLNGRDYELSVENGKASLTLSDLEVGKYDVTVTFSGDDEYLEATNSTSFNVLKVNIPVTDDVMPEPGDSTSYSIDLPADATGTLTVSVDGENYTSKVVNGKATVNIPKLTGGSHNIAVAYSGDAKYSPIVKNRTVNVAIVNLTGYDISMLYTSGDYYRVCLTQDGAPLIGKTVSVTINGVTYTPVTGNDGYASVQITLAPNTYTATAVYGDLNTTNDVVVKSIVKAKNINAKKSAKSIKVNVKLKKVNGQYLKGKKVTLKFNKKKFKVKTNKKGVATFKIKKGVYKKLKSGKKYAYQVKYGKDKVKKTIKFK